MGILERLLYIISFSYNHTYILYSTRRRKEGGGEEMNWFVKGYRSVLRDSPNDILAGLMLAIIVVLELPPKLSFNNLKEK